MLMLMMLFAAGVKWFSALPFAAAHQAFLASPANLIRQKKLR
jgi:hypothetical protein